MTADLRKPRHLDRRTRTERPGKIGLEARYQRAMTLARASVIIEDRVEAERYFQQADHLRRLINGQPAHGRS